MCIFCFSRQHMCCWWSARVCESEIMRERELQRWVRKQVRTEWAGRGCTRRRVWRLCNKLEEEELLRGGQGRRNAGRDWEKVRDGKMSNRASERERVRGRRRRWLRGAHKWNSPRGSIWVSAEIKAKRSTGNMVQSDSCDWHTGHLGNSWHFSSFVNDPAMFSSLLWSLESSWDLSACHFKALCLCRVKSDVKRCNKSLKVVCRSETPSGWIVLSNLFCPVARLFPPPGRFSVFLSRGC